MSHHPEKAGMPGSQTLPHRQRSGAVSEDEAVPDFDLSNTSGLLLERLQAWKHACGYLENYISATEKIHKAHAKEYEKVLKTVSDPLREGQHFDQSLGGIAGLFENIRSNTQGIANSHLETEKNLKGSVLPILERLHSEIKNKSKELSSGADKGAKDVDKTRNNTQKYIELLGQHTASFDASGGKIEPHNDPYILQRAVYHHLHKQVLEENNNRQDLIAVEQSFQQFEAHVIQTVQQAMGSFLQYVGGQAERQKGMYSDMVGTTQRIPLDFEWRRFVKRNQQMLIDPEAPPRSVDNISFPNQNHRATQSLIEGTLERKGRAIGALKGHSTGYYVITPSKFLHEFKSDDDFHKEPTPELSLYLPDCTIGVVNGEKFNIKGKDVSKGKVGSALSLSHEFSFKAHSPADAEKWWNVIRSAAGAGAMTGEMPGRSEPSSPVDSDHTSGTQPPVYEEKHSIGQQPAPVQTQGLQHGQGDYPPSAGGGQQYTSPQEAGGSGQRAYDSPTGVGGRDFAAPQSAGGVGVQSATAPQGTHSGIDRAPGQY
ncbi:MAG: hypothetical protein M1830_004492 [Pleopsidium flavum]|nr:MAG: hypothetical protein M1830_004492 [Pleopsidium flavum]